MKNYLFGIVALAMLASVAHADETRMVNNQRLKAQEDNLYSQLCMASLESKYVLRERAEELGFNPTRLSQITCNGLSIREFAAVYGEDRIVTQATKRPSSRTE